MLMQGLKRVEQEAQRAAAAKEALRPIVTSGGKVSFSDMNKEYGTSIWQVVQLVDEIKEEVKEKVV